MFEHLLTPIGWITFGYFISVAMIRLFRRRTLPPDPSTWPSITVIVPCFNEEAAIAETVEYKHFQLSANWSNKKCQME